MHARVVSNIYKVVNNFEGQIYFEYCGSKVSGRDMLDLLSLGITKNSRVIVSLDGREADEIKLEKELKELEANNFGDED